MARRRRKKGRNYPVKGHSRSPRGPDRGKKRVGVIKYKRKNPNDIRRGRRKRRR